MTFSIPEKPPLLMPASKASPEHLLAGRPRTQEPVQPPPGELMNIPVMAASLFQGPAPQVGQAVELVCVRADGKGWGLALRVKPGSAVAE